MPCLRMRYHASAVYLGDGVPPGRALVEGMAAVAVTESDYTYVKFQGFTSDDSQGQRVKLVNINAYTTEPFRDPWLEYGHNAKVLGVLVPGQGVYCYLKDMTPVVWCDWPRHSDGN